MLWIALPALVSAKTAIAVDHSGALLDLTTDTATDEIRVRDQELLHVMANDVEDPNSGGSSEQMEIRSSPEELMETTMHASLLNETQHTPKGVVTAATEGSGRCDEATRPAPDTDGADLAGWAKHAKVDILGASNLWDSVTVKQRYGDIGRQIRTARPSQPIHVTMIITAKRVAAFGEAASWFDEEKDVLDAIFGPQATPVLQEWDKINLAKNKKIEVHTEERRKVLLESKLPIIFNYVDIHGEVSGRSNGLSMDLDCFAEPMPISGPCSFPLSLGETDIIHVLGGNTFYLQEMISTHDTAKKNMRAIKKWATTQFPGLLFGQSAGMIFIMDKDAAGALMKAMEKTIVEANILIAKDTPQGFKICTNPEKSYTVKLNPLAVTWQGGSHEGTVGGDIDGYLKFMMAKKGNGIHSEQICLPPVSPEANRSDVFLNAIPKIGSASGQQYQHIASVPHMQPDLVCKVQQNMHRTGYEAGFATANKDGFLHIAGRDGASHAGIYLLEFHNAYLLDVPLNNSGGTTRCVQHKLEEVYGQRQGEVAACTTQPTPSHLSPIKRGSIASPLPHSVKQGILSATPKELSPVHSPRRGRK